MSITSYQLLAKQAIYDSNKDCVGHELLFRSPMSFAAADVGGEVATQQVLVNYCTSITESAETSSWPVYINVDPAFLLAHDTLPVDPEKVYLEVNDLKEFGEDVSAAIKKWRKQGFKLGLAGFSFVPSHLKALPFFDFVKVDLLNVEPNDLAPKLQGVSRPDKQVWVAERLEDEAKFEACKSLGFDRFQGHFLAKPKDVMGASIRPGTAVTVRIVKELENPNISMDEVAELVSQDPKLAVQMIKIINSSLFALPKKVEDLKSALVFLGIDMLRHWAMILAFLSNGAVHIEASRIILSRAKTSELLCLSSAETSSMGPNAFLAGLVSGVDVLFSVSQELFLEQVVLSEDIVEAVLDNKGSLGGILQQVKTLEEAVTQGHLNLADFSPAVIESYRAADAWVDQVVNILKS